MINLVTGLKSLQMLGVSSIRDTISSKHHSRDFKYARAEYMRVRVMLLGLAFAVLTPLWAFMDAMILPQWVSNFLPVRLSMFCGLLLCAGLAYRGQDKISLIYALSGLVFILPAGFYGYMLWIAPESVGYIVEAYGFIPFLLVATLSVFPFTLIESSLVGLALLALQFYASYQKGLWLSPQSLQDAWLLAALLVVSLTANYFHLGLLQRLYRQATHDPLTGLLNRGALNAQAMQLVRAPRPMGIHILMIDLDHFKQINDTHGHSVGDSVLATAGVLLRSVCQPDCLVARYGGEEFVVLILGRTDQKAWELAQLLRNNLAELTFLNHDRQHFSVTASMGLTAHDVKGSLADSLRRADALLYQAKHQGRDRVSSDVVILPEQVAA